MLLHCAGAFGIRIDLAIFFFYINKCWPSKRLLCDINPLITMDDLKLIDSNIFIGYLANKDNATVDTRASKQVTYSCYSKERLDALAAPGAAEESLQVCLHTRC